MSQKNNFEFAMKLEQFLIFAIISINALSCCPMNKKEQIILNQWVAGESVSCESIASFGKDNCFSSQDIDDKIFERMKGRSYGDDCTIPISELQYIKVLHYDIAGNIILGEMVCNRSISNDLLDIFRALFDAHYPIERMVLVDEYNADDEASMTANNSSCFNFRFISGTNRLSNHSMGLAVDINPLYNPYVRESKGQLIVEPAAAKEYVTRTIDYQYKIDRNDLCYREFIKHGFEWGGDWTDRKDYQHFEKIINK